jgi:hypothetical protein
MKRNVTGIAALIVATGVGAAFLSMPSTALAHGPQASGTQWWGQGYGQGMMHRGYGGCPDYGMGSGTMGSGMMGRQGMGPGMMGPGMIQSLRQDLSAADVRHMMEHQLAWQGNSNLKLGKVEEADSDTIVAEIVTRDGSLVQRMKIDRHTGWMQREQ